jgi:hypothetical protein
VDSPGINNHDVKTDDEVATIIDKDVSKEGDASVTCSNLGEPHDLEPIEKICIGSNPGDESILEPRLGYEEFAEFMENSQTIGAGAIGSVKNIDLHMISRRDTIKQQGKISECIEIIANNIISWTLEIIAPFNTSTDEREDIWYNLAKRSKWNIQHINDAKEASRASTYAEKRFKDISTLIDTSHDTLMLEEPGSIIDNIH